MSSLFLQQLFSGKAPIPVAKPAQLNAVIPTVKRGNPFMLSTQSDSESFMQMYGKNQPLDKAMFLGHRGDQAVYAGSRLFILY